MPTYDNTAKHGLRALQGTNVIADIDAGIRALADDLDAIIATDDQGTLASRPVSTPGSPGKSGRWYRSSENGGMLWRDFGTGYDQVHVEPLEGSFSAYRNAALSLATDQVVTFDTEEWDVSNWYGTATGRFTPQVAGYYRLSAALRGTLTVDKYMYGRILKNGSTHRYMSYAVARATEIVQSVGSALVLANGSTDYFEVVLTHSLSGSLSLVTGAPGTFFQSELVGRS